MVGYHVVVVCEFEMANCTYHVLFDDLEIFET